MWIGKILAELINFATECTQIKGIRTMNQH